jgi:hypothetical protein
MSRIGKRYECPVCSTVILCLRPGPLEFHCHDQAMNEKQMEQLPSGD